MLFRSDDPIARHAEQPRTHLLDGFRQTVRRHELVEHILQDVLRLARIRHVPPDEIPQPPALARNRFSEAFILLGHQRIVG